ncbi:RepA leader peptide Tap (plasmid) [Yersinia pestis]
MLLLPCNISAGRCD